MRNTFRTILAAMAILATQLVAAAPAADAPTVAEKCSGVKIATGPKGKGYSKLFANIKDVCGAVVPVCEVNTEGGLDNGDVMANKKAEVGFMPVDVWQTMGAKDENIGALRALMGLNSNYLHIFSKKSGIRVEQGREWYGKKKDDAVLLLDALSKLRGQRVALVGSAALLGRQLDRTNKLDLQIVDAKDDASARAMLDKGEVAAFMTVAGWPIGVLNGVSAESGLMLAAFDIPVPSQTYNVRALTYKGIGMYGVNSLGIPNVLLARQFSGPKAAEIAKLRQCIVDNLTALKEGEYEPAWNEVKDVANTFGVPAWTAPGVPAPVAKKK